MASKACDPQRPRRIDDISTLLNRRPSLGCITVRGTSSTLTTPSPPPQSSCNVRNPSQLQLLPQPAYHSHSPPHSMLSRRIVAARPLTRALLSPAAAARPQFTQVRARSTPSEVQDLSESSSYSEIYDPYMVSHPWAVVAAVR